jgi:HPt (histidine-containing phosphotransfer) domain-containing protein
MKPLSNMDLDVSKFRGAFFEEAEEHLATMETTLVELSERPDDAEQLARIFRAAHSLKGAGGTFGFTDIARLTPALRDRRQHLVANTTCGTCHMMNPLRFDFHNFGYLEDRDLTVSPRVTTDVELDLRFLRGR